MFASKSRYPKVFGGPVSQLPTEIGNISIFITRQSTLKISMVFQLKVIYIGYLYITGARFTKCSCIYRLKYVVHTYDAMSANIPGTPYFSVYMQYKSSYLLSETSPHPQASKNRVPECPQAPCLTTRATKITKLQSRTCPAGHHNPVT